MIADSEALKLIGSIFLLYLAYKELESGSASNEAHVSEKSRFKLRSEVFFLTLTSPITILSFIGSFASIGVGLHQRYTSQHPLQSI